MMIDACVKTYASGYDLSRLRRIHRLLLHVSHVPWSMRVLGLWWGCAKTDKPIVSRRMRRTRVGPRKRALDVGAIYW